MESMIMIVALFAVMYFFMIRPENKRKKQAQNMRDSLKKGDMITTIGGIVGRIVMVNPNTIVIETSDDRVCVLQMASLFLMCGAKAEPQIRRSFAVRSRKRGIFARMQLPSPIRFEI